jgi:ribonucleoside-diphosphate reductase alpha chain
VTVYRQGSRDDEVFNLLREAVIPTLPPDWERPEWLPAWARKTAGGCGTKYVIISYDTIDGHALPVEVFVPSGEGCHASDEGETRLISKMLQVNIPAAEIDKQLHKVKCPTAMLSQKQGRSSGHSCPDIVGNTLRTVAEKFLNQAASPAATAPAPVPARRSAVCPDCGAALGFAEGCGKGTCRSCGWSGCT